ncbi:hypothetical protein GIB67_034314 [Kingdonia uniflora]|uniref:Protein downstream neighbor of Son n=1 Tax=Kingdonia uniflora TaxID=39325 RepID=A0A7J7NSH3_9MAGN|nr:hypothetical protein GIB67_034314 [Kingdonia uniflora]
MAKVAVSGPVPGPLSSNSLPFGRGVSNHQAGTTMKKRKTPLELRGEQLKRRTSAAVIDEFLPASFGYEKSGGTVYGTKKAEISKNPRYIDTRVTEVFPVKKSSNIFRILNEKEKAKENFSSEQTSSLKHPPFTCNVDAKSKTQPASVEYSEKSAASATDNLARPCPRAESCSQTSHRSVTEISLGNGKSSGSKTMDMESLKHLGALHLPSISRLHTDGSERSVNISSPHLANFSSEIDILGHKIPLDFTLKATIRLVSSSSVNWCHRLSTSSNLKGVIHFASQFDCFGNQNVCHPPRFSSTPADLFSKALHSWMYPQSSLPPTVISALNLSAGHGEMDFLSKRQLAWEDSFRSLYYMLRKNMCNLFYVCTSQFVVMFIGGDCLGKTKQTCNAYITQSTRVLRSFLSEHNVSFSMPLCHSKAEQATAEDLFELSEIKRNLGQQTGRLGSTPDLDNSPQSLLAFNGNTNVHGLYDFLLNYRSLLSSLITADVPVLISPVPFQNASLSTPEVKCTEMKRSAFVPSLQSKEGELSKESSTGVCYSIEIKDTVLPPWTVCGVCASMGGEGRSFDACFTDDPISVGLNVALDSICHDKDAKTELSEELSKHKHKFIVPEAVISPCLRSSSLKNLKYSNGSYTASLLPV